MSALRHDRALLLGEPTRTNCGRSGLKHVEHRRDRMRVDKVAWRRSACGPHSDNLPGSPQNVVVRRSPRLPMAGGSTGKAPGGSSAG
jgi:hypothetical protein